mmetsp:Transcript_92048/g.112713  ORF Transcript_92048/g.112713 Transcript_92048/m.112713 type:complete len:343 (+) Transcript_92048:38-1066(+)
MTDETKGFNKTEIGMEQLIHDINELVYNNDLCSLTQKMIYNRLNNKYGIDLTKFKANIYQESIKIARNRIKADPALQILQKTYQEQLYNNAYDNESYDNELQMYNYNEFNSDNARKRGRPKKNYMENARKKTKLNDEIEFDLDKNMKYIFSDILCNIMNKNEGNWLMVWDFIMNYVDKNNLRMGTRKVKCDDLLKKLFNNKDDVTMTTISRNIWKHLYINIKRDISVHDQRQLNKQQNKALKKDNNNDNNDDTKYKGNPRGFAKLVNVSNDMKNIFNIDKPIPRHNVTKIFWKYVKNNKLKRDGRIIYCDDGLKLLFNCNQIHMYHVQKLLKNHMQTINDNI